ncbi:MAG: type II toxin-antitoxin system Phd/YefM family antitoxin [Acidobacteriota bacterium]
MQGRWQLQEAKNRFSELVETTLRAGPQVVTRRGEDTVVVVPIETYRALTRATGSLVEFFAKSPLRGAKLSLARDGDTGRTVDL